MLETLGVMSVATNIYFDYWKRMVQSADDHTAKSDQVTFFVFTERIDEVPRFSRTLRNVTVIGFKIPALVWPEATLLRYQIFSESFPSMERHILVHLDADMIFVANPWNLIRSALQEKEICLVHHPGYWRPRGFQKLSLYFSHPNILYRDLRTKFRLGGLGAWETRSKSKAFVPRISRHVYFCGGIWFGRRMAISALMRSLAQTTHEDNLQDLIAVWHDESHLNRWASTNSHGSVTPEFCFDETYPQLSQLNPLIVAVRKLKKTR